MMIALVITLTSLLFLPPAEGAEDTGTGAASIGGDRFVKSVSAIIELKGENRIVILERSYLVTEKTIILDEKGKNIRLDQLPTPCEAVVKYQLRIDQSPLCLKISMKKPITKTRSINE